MIGGAGSLLKQGTGTLTLIGNNTYSGGTTVTGGLVNFATLGNFGTGNMTLNGGGVQWAAGTSTDISARLAALGVNGGTLDTNGNNVTLANGISGTGSLTKAGNGVLTLAGNNTYTGGTFVTGGSIALTGSIAGPVGVSGGLFSANGTIGGTVTVSGTGTLSGTGTVGGIAMTGGTVAPGNSIGTLNVAGNYVQSSGIYQVEVNSAGQADRINVTGTATLSGGTVQVVADQTGTYARNTSYTILTATGGITGTYSNATSNLAFLTPTLSYSSTSVTLMLEMLQSAFRNAAQTPNQAAVGAALDAAAPTATGDFANVINALSVLNTQQGPAALTAISGQNYSALSSASVQSAQLFMSNFANQASGATRGGSAAQAAGATSARSARRSLQRRLRYDGDRRLGRLGRWHRWFRHHRRQQQLEHRHLQPRRLRRRHRPPGHRGAAGGLHPRLFERHAVDLGLLGPQHVEHLPGRPLRLVPQGPGLRRRPRGLCLLGQPDAAADPDPGSEFAGRHRPDRHEPVLRSDRSRLSHRSRHDGECLPDAVGPPAGLDRDTERPHRKRCGLAQPHRRVADDQLAALGTGCHPGRGDGHRVGQQARRPVQGGLGARVRQYRPAGDGVVPRRAGPAVHDLRRRAAADGVILGINATANLGERTNLFLRYEGEFQGIDNSHAFSAGIRFTW